MSSVLVIHTFLPGSVLLQFEYDDQDQEKLLLPEVKKGFAGHNTGVVEQESHLAKPYLIWQIVHLTKFPTKWGMKVIYKPIFFMQTNKQIEI